VAAASYDSKWGIDFGEIARSRSRKAAEGARPLAAEAVRNALDGRRAPAISLNLLQAGAIERARQRHSPGMLARLEGTPSGFCGQWPSAFRSFPVTALWPISPKSMPHLESYEAAATSW